MMFPELAGRPITLEFRPRLRAWRGRLLSADGRGAAVHAASFLRRRLIVLDAELRRDPEELSRIYIHELFHFAWLRLGNPHRRSYEDLLAAEVRLGLAGELGWSAQWRKQALRPADLRRRSRRWREYVCESFCDTGAWRFSGVGRHGEFTLPVRARRLRAAWLAAQGLDRRLPV